MKYLCMYIGEGVTGDRGLQCLVAVGLAYTTTTQVCT